MFTGTSNITLRISTIDDHPTLVSVSGSGIYHFTEGNSPTSITGILLDDGDAINSDVMVENVTIEILGGAYNEILDILSTASTITVSKITNAKSTSFIFFTYLQKFSPGQRLVLQGPAYLTDFQTLLLNSPPFYSLHPSTEPPCPLERYITVSMQSTGGLAHCYTPPPTINR